MPAAPACDYDDADQWNDADRICIVSVARRVAGDGTADRLQAQFGGTRLFIPMAIEPDHFLVKAIGLKAAWAIAREIGGTTSWVTRGRFRPEEIVIEIVRWASMAGLVRASTAPLAGVSERHVRHVAAKLRRAGKLPAWLG